MGQPAIHVINCIEQLEIFHAQTVHSICMAVLRFNFARGQNFKGLLPLPANASHFEAVPGDALKSNKEKLIKQMAKEKVELH